MYECAVGDFFSFEKQQRDW
ncbi:unnamed protein product [Victoria cruziana]